MPTNRIGIWAAFGVTLTGVAYGVALGIGFAVFGLSKPIVDPLLAIMEVLTMLSALLLLVMMSAVHTYALPEHKTLSLIAFALMVCAVGLTCTVHFVELTALRQIGTAGIVWPSVPYAVELLAWNFLLGLSLLFASRVFVDGDRAVRVRHGLMVCGALCLSGTIGPAVGNMRLQFIGVFGYAVVLPIISLMVARAFRADRRNRAAAPFPERP